MRLVRNFKSFVSAAAICGGGMGSVCSLAAALSCSSESEPGATVTSGTGVDDAAGVGIAGGAASANPELSPAPGAGSGPPDGAEASAESGQDFGLTDDLAEPASCADKFVPAILQPPVIQFVVDTSGSMNWVAGTERAPAAGEQSKWTITQQALANAIAAMPDDVAIGLSYYPNTEGDGAECIQSAEAAPIDRLSPEHRALIERVNAAQVPQGGTPTHAAYEFGVEQLEASSLPGSRFVVLITDGIPTFTRECAGDGRTRVDAAPLIMSVAERQQAGIRTFVIGSPGSEAAREELSTMASLGGTAAAGCDPAGPNFCHFDMTGEPNFSQALSQAFEDITDATLACDYAVPAAPGSLRLDLDDVSVVLESGSTTLREFKPAASAACEEGWLYSDDKALIRLCKSTCDELAGLVRENPDAAVRVRFGCRVTPR
jgi:von Willebrand factor type A domain-containing protein